MGPSFLLWPQLSSSSWLQHARPSLFEPGKKTTWSDNEHVVRLSQTRHIPRKALRFFRLPIRFMGFHNGIQRHQGDGAAFRPLDRLHKPAKPRLQRNTAHNARPAVHPSDRMDRPHARPLIARLSFPGARPPSPPSCPDSDQNFTRRMVAIETHMVCTIVVGIIRRAMRSRSRHIRDIGSRCSCSPRIVRKLPHRTRPLCRPHVALHMPRRMRMLSGFRIIRRRLRDRRIPRRVFILLPSDSGR